MANAKGMEHPKRRRRTCINGHRYSLQNTRITMERRWSKRRQEWVTYRARQCRACWRELKRITARRKRAGGRDWI